MLKGGLQILSLKAPLSAGAILLVLLLLRR